MTLVIGSSSALSLLESVLRRVVLERGSVETEGALPVDCTPTIKLVKGLLEFKKYSVSVLETTYLNLAYLL